VSFKIVLLPPDVNESWPEKIRQAVPGAMAKAFKDPKDAVRDIADADAAYGTVPPELFARAKKLRWICAARAGLGADSFYDALVKVDEDGTPAYSARTMITHLAPRDHTVKLDGLALHYCEWGAPAARPLVLLHGITGHARTWDYLATALQPTFRVIALDQRGHGDSQWSPNVDYSVGAMAGDVDRLADHLGLARFALLGLSMGGRVAIAFGGIHPERVERLVIVDIGPDIAPEGMERVRGMVGGAPERFATEDEALGYVRRANPRYNEAELHRRVAHGLTRLADGGLAWKYDKAIREAMRLGIRREAMNLWEPLACITCPSLLVRGAESDILSPEIAERMLANLPDGRLVEIAGAGHSVPGDHPEAFAAAVRSFLA
jgi:esterase